MGLRFTRRLRLFPGVSVNLSKSGASMSFGVRGAHYTVGPRGRRVTVGIPGTGLYYTESQTSPRVVRSQLAGDLPQQAAAVPIVAPSDRLHLGFFKRLVTPPEEQRFVEGLRAAAQGNEDEAFAHFSAAMHIPDGAMFAGVLALKRGRLTQAEEGLRFAADHPDGLGAALARYGITSSLSVQITDDLTAHVPHTHEGALLVLAEILQKGGRRADALRALRDIRANSPQDPVMLASMCELLLDGATDAERQEVVTLTDGVQNLTPIQTIVLLFRARALRQLKLPEAAARTATAALTRRTGRSGELLHELRYERALAYSEAGDGKRSRADLERLYAEDSSFSDVGRRLGLDVPSTQTT